MSDGSPAEAMLGLPAAISNWHAEVNYLQVYMSIIVLATDNSLIIGREERAHLVVLSA